MKPTTAILLARPAASSERGRIRLITAAAAVAAGLIVAAMRVSRMRVGFDSAELQLYGSDDWTRPTLLTAVALLTIPTLAFTVQALRAGSAARDRRMAALRLAGATPRDVRIVAGTEAGVAALVGGLLGGWVYAALWLVLGVLPPAELRVLPAPDTLDIGVWAAVAFCWAQLAPSPGPPCSSEWRPSRLACSAERGAGVLAG